MKTKTLIETNPYMIEPDMRKALILRSVDTSCAVEGVKLSAKDSAPIDIPNRIKKRYKQTK